MKAIITLSALQVFASAIASPIDNWTTRSDSGTSVMRGVAFGNGRFVAAGDGFEVSTNGVNWNLNPMSGASCAGIAFGNGIFVAVDGDKTYSSTNGETWIMRRVFGAGSFQSITYGGGLFLAVGANGQISTSATGEYWTSSKQDVGTLNFASYAGGRFFFSGNSRTYSSTNGASFSEVNAPAMGKIGMIGGKYFGSLGPYYSTNGTTWTPTGGNVPSGMNDLVSAGGMLIGCDDGSTVWTSIDGTNWVSRPNSVTTAYFRGIASGFGKIAVVGYTPQTQGVITVSDEIAAAVEALLHLSFYPAVQVSGSLGRTYRIESSSEAEGAPWEPLNEITLTRSPQLWFDESFPPTKRFYRAVLSR